MTLSAVDPIVTYTYTGPGTFAYNFGIWENSEMQVTFIDATGTRTVKTLTTHYTLDKNEDFEGGNVTTTFAGTGFLELKMNLPYEQDFSWSSGGPLILATFERMADKIIGRIQMLNYFVENSISLPSFLGDWVTSFGYSVGDLVIGSGNNDLYHCKISHTSGTFATDVAAGRWEIVLSESMIAAAVDLPTISAGDVGKAIRVDSTESSYELDHIVPRAQTANAGEMPVVDIAGTDYEAIMPQESPSPRAKFEYVSTTQIKVYGYAKYHLYGKGYLSIESSSGLTLTPSLSGTSYWHFIYLDYSAITQRLLDSSSYFTDSTTAPTFNYTKKGYYNGDDRCIFAIYVDGSGNIVNFWHFGDDICWWDDRRTVRAYAAMAAGWANTVPFATAVPPFSTEVQFQAFINDTTTSSILDSRLNGSTTTVGLRIGRVNATSSTWDTITMRHALGTSQGIQFKASAGTTTSLEVHASAWFFPQHI